MPVNRASPRAPRLDSQRAMAENETMQSGPSVHPIVAFAGQVGGNHAIRGHVLAQRIARLTADVQMGPALHEGEVVLVALDYEFPARGRAQGSHATLLLSDRRIYGSLVSSNITSTLVDLPYAQVAQITDDGGLMNHAMTAYTAHGSLKFPMYGKELVPIFRNLLALPPEQRTLGPLRIQPGPGDPVGAHAAAASLVSGSPITRALPTLAYEAGRQRRLPEAEARSILERVVIVDRSLVMGRGMHRGQWLSTLPRPALAPLLAALLGAPVHSTGDAHWESHDFAIEAAGRSAGAAAAASAAGLAAAALFGVGFMARAGGGLGFSTLRATIVDFPCGSGVTLAAAQGPHTFKLPFSATGLLEPLFQALSRVEQRQILAEIALAGHLPPAELARVPRPALEAACAQLGAPLDLSAIYPQG